MTESRYIPRDLWKDFPPLDALEVASDLDGDAAFLLRGLTNHQIESLSRISLEYLHNDIWVEAPFSESSAFPSKDWDIAPCWYFPFDYHPLFELVPDLRGTPPEWRAVVPSDWVYPKA